MNSRISLETCPDTPQSGTTALTNPAGVLIAEKLRARDPQILDHLIVQHQHRLLRYLLYLTGNRETAEEMFQETWMRVITKGEQFRGESQFVTWLFSIARNLVLELRRRTSHIKEVSTTGDGQPLEIPSTTRSPFDRCALKEREHLIKTTLLTLSPAQREVLVLHFLEEMPLKEVARLTGVQLTTAKTRLYRALVALRSSVSNTEHPVAQLKRFQSQNSRSATQVRPHIRTRGRDSI